ncbi:unnamed protein product [Urochloa humidicola]
MEAPRAARSDDLISKLPLELLSEIISRLATAEAARTAVLSTRWRDAWRGTPLRLDDLELPAPASERAAAEFPWDSRALTPALADAVGRALASHPGPVARFRLARTSLGDRVPATEALFRDLAAAKHAREVSLCGPPEWCHLALADPLLASPTIETLALGECRISDAVAGAASAARLTELTLSKTHISHASLQSVLSGCPALRILMLKYIHGPNRIHISSCPNLKLLGLWLFHYIMELTVEDVPRLERLLGSVNLGMTMTVVGAPKLTALGYLNLRFVDIYHDELPRVNVGKGLRTPIHSLKILAVDARFHSKKDMDNVMGFLRCCPLLETLHFEDAFGNLNHEDVTIGSSYYLMLGRVDCIVNTLKSVRLETRCDNYSMILFACFVLANAKRLQILRIQSLQMGCTDAWFANQRNLLSESRCVSLEAEVDIQRIKQTKCKGFSVDAVDALADPFDSDINIGIADTLRYG